jgi:ABC-2 type transport system permease protein
VHPTVFGRIWAIIQKEFLQVLRERRTLAIILVMPMLQLLLLGYAINLNIDNIATVISDEAQDEPSRRFVQSLVQTRYFRIVGYAASPREAQRRIDEGTARVAVLIPPGFSRDLLAGRQAAVQVLIDATDPNLAQTALFTADATGQVSAREVANGLRGREGPRAAAPFELRPLLLYNPNLESVYFIVPGLIGILLQTQAVVLTAFAVVRERERGTLEQLVVTPIRAWELLLGKVLPYVVISFLQIGTTLALGVYWFGMPFRGSLVLLLGLSLVFLLGALGMGLLVSTITRTQAQAMQTSLFLWLPSLILSGVFFPRDAMPPAVAAVGNFVPLTYFVTILRGIILKGNGVAELWPQVLPMAGLAAAMFVLSALRFRKSLE